MKIREIWADYMFGAGPSARATVETCFPDLGHLTQLCEFHRGTQFDFFNNFGKPGVDVSFPLKLGHYFVLDSADCNSSETTFGRGNT